MVFATQSLADIRDSSIAPAIVESCASRIFLPNPQAFEPQIRAVYEGFGLNGRQIEIVATATPKRDYYYQSRLGNRVFDPLGLGPVALAFAASSPEDQRRWTGSRRPSLPGGRPAFAAAWLRHRGPGLGRRPHSHVFTVSNHLKRVLPCFFEVPVPSPQGALACSLRSPSAPPCPPVPSWAAAAHRVRSSNYSQNMLTAARTLEQINNQIGQLQNQGAISRAWITARWGIRA